MITAVYALAFMFVTQVYLVLQAYAPTNIVIRWIRRREHLKWGLPLGAALAVGYWLAMTGVVAVVDPGQVTWLTFVAILLFWNAVKFAAVAIMSPFQVARARFVERRYERQIVHSRVGSPGWG
jgi:hypothetical protein